MSESKGQGKWWLSWNGKESGPFSAAEIHRMLEKGAIHSLYKVKVAGEWVRLRDRIGDLREHEPLPKVALDPLPEEFGPGEDGAGGLEGPWDGPGEDGAGGVGGAASRMALAALGMAGCFFVPYLNALTWMGALLLGHQALARHEDAPAGPGAVQAWTALWLAYTEIVFFLLLFCSHALMFGGIDMSAYYWLHGRMFFFVMTALLGSGVLMGLVRLFCGWLPRPAEAVVASLVPHACVGFATWWVEVVRTSASGGAPAALVLLVFAVVLAYALQTVIMARVVRSPAGEALGMGRASLTAIPCAVGMVLAGVAGLWVLRWA